MYTRSYIKMENLNKYGKVQHGNGREKGLCGNNLNLIRYHSQFLQEMKGQDNLDTWRGGLSKAYRQTVPGRPNQTCIPMLEQQEQQQHFQLVCTYIMDKSIESLRAKKGK